MSRPDHDVPPALAQSLDATLNEIFSVLSVRTQGSVSAVIRNLRAIVDDSVERVTGTHARESYSLLPISKLPAELLHAIFTPLDLDDCISVSQVCRVWRTASTEHPVLWSRISRVENRKLLALVLQRAGSLPVDLVDLHISDEHDLILEIVQRHMALLKTLRFQFTSHPKHMAKDSRAYKLLQTPAPLLEKLAILGNPNASFTLSLGAIDGLFAGVAPCLREVQLMAISGAAMTFRSLPPATMRQIESVAIGGHRCRFSYNGIARVANILPNLHTMNLDLRGWKDNGESDELSNPHLRRINIISTRPDHLLLHGARPPRPGWIDVPEVRIAYTWPDQATWADECRIPLNGSAIVKLEVRAQNHPSLVSLRATHADQTVRIYSGIHLQRITTILGEVPHEVEVLTISAHRDILEVFGSVEWPKLHNLRLLADRHYFNPVGKSVEQLDCTDESTDRTSAADMLNDCIVDIIRRLKPQDKRSLEVVFDGFEPIVSVQDTARPDLKILWNQQQYRSDDGWITEPVFEWS